MSAVDDLELVAVDHTEKRWIPAEGSLSLAWAQAQDACPEGWRVIGFSDYGDGRAMSTAGTNPAPPPVRCPNCGQLPESKPTTITAWGLGPADSLNSLAIKLRALA